MKRNVIHRIAPLLLALPILLAACGTSAATGGSGNAAGSAATTVSGAASATTASGAAGATTASGAPSSTTASTAKSASDAASAPADGSTVIRIGYLPITHAVPLFVENESPIDGVKLELVKFGSWPELLDGLNTGALDGASMLIELAMKAKEQGIDLKAVALGHRDGNVVVVANDIATAADLKGKTFAIPHRQSTHNILLHVLLANNGLTESDVNIVELAPPEMPAALAEGRISGYCVAEPFGAKTVAAGGGKVLYESGDLWEGSLCCSLILRNEFIQKNPEAAASFVKAYAAAGEVAEAASRDDASTLDLDAVTGKYLKADKTVLDLSFEWISYKNLAIGEKEYESLRTYLTGLGLSKNPPAYADFVDSTLIAGK